MPLDQSRRKPIILASGSPHRCQLLRKLGIDFEAAAPDIDERARIGESPDALAVRLAREKAASLSSRFPVHLIIGSDQVAMLNGLQVTKPGGPANSVQQLQAASGQWMDFYTSVGVLDSLTGKWNFELDHTRVRFRQLSEAQVRSYVEKEPAFDCAGAFKSEGLGIALFECLQSDDPNALVGLPLIRLIGLLDALGVEVL